MPDVSPAQSAAPDLMAALLRSLEMPKFSVARSGQVHDFHCFALSHDGPCDCPLVLARLEPRRRTGVV